MAARKTNDITKTGPQSYRDLQKANAEVYTQASAISPLAKLKGPSYAQSTDFIYEGLEKSPLLQQSGGTDYWGNSIWDSSEAVEESYNNLGDVRASNQPAWVQAVNGTLKGTVLAGTTFVDGTLGLIAGLGTGVSNAFSDDPNKHFVDGLWDNPIVNLMDQVQKLSEEYLPNYRTQVQQDSPWYSIDNLTSANFIFDTVIKNSGFTVGAAFSGGVYTKAIDWAAKAINAGRMAAGLSAATIEAGEKAMQASTATRATKMVVGSFFNAHAEALQEAYNSSQEFIKIENQRLENNSLEQKNNALQQFIYNGGSFNIDGTPDPTSNYDAYQALQRRFKEIDQAVAISQEEIVKQSKNVGTMTGILNIPILTIDNMLMFGKMYAGGWKAGRASHRTQTKATKEAIRDAKAAVKAGDKDALKKLKDIVKKAETSGYESLTEVEKGLVREAPKHLFSKPVGITYAALKGPVREGLWEEMMQGAMSQAANYRYSNEIDRIFDAQLNIEADHKTRGLFESIQQGILKQYGDIDAYEEAFVGGIIGLFGSPTFGRKNNSTNQTYLGKSKWIGMSGGTITEVRDYLRERKQKDEVASKATEVLRSGTLGNNMKHLIAQTSFQDDMKRAIIHDDEREYKDARTAAIFEQVMHLRRAGRLDLLQRAMQVTSEFTDEDIAEIVELTGKQISTRDENVQEKTQQIKRLEQSIQAITEDIEQYFLEGQRTGNYDKYNDLMWELEDKKEELTLLEAEVATADAFYVSPYMHQDGSAFTAEEVKQDINKRIDNFDKIIKLITDSQDEIDAATSEVLTNEQIDTLTWYRVMMKDWEDRSQQMTTKYKELFTQLASRPEFRKALEAIKSIESILKEAGIDQNAAEIHFGGRLESLRNVSTYNDILEQILQAVNLGGLNFAYLLSSSEKLEGTDKTLGEIITEQFEFLINSDETKSKDFKQTVINTLKDLKAIGNSHRKYNELLDEYLKNPKGIDQAHENSINAATQQQSSNRMNQTINGIDWNAPIGSIASYLKNNASSIQDAGGIDKLMEGLTPEQKEKLEKAKQLVMGIDSLDDLIDDKGLTDEGAMILRDLIDEKVPFEDSIEGLLDSLKDGIQNGEIEDKLSDSVPQEIDDELKERQLAAIELELHDFLDEISNDLINSITQMDEALSDFEDKIANAVPKDNPQAEPNLNAVPKDTNPEDNVPQDNIFDPGKSSVPQDKTGEDITDIPQDNTQQPRQEQEEEPAVSPATTLEQIFRENKKVTPPQEGQPGFNRRRQISEYYLHGQDKETLPQHYEEYPEDIPKGVDPEAFKQYIKAVHKYLVERGAYTYISGVNPNLKLKTGQKILFTTDKELNAKAGVPVILMMVIDEQGNQQVIGSLPTSIDFQALRRGGDKTIGEIYPEDKALYEELCNELLSNTNVNSNVSSITTTVESLRSGDPAFSSFETSISRVFGNEDIPITIISNTDRSSAAVTNPLMPLMPINGQVYVYVTSNTGAQIPLLCLSMPLRSIIAQSNSWYITETTNAILALSNVLNVGQNKAKIRKWLPSLKNLNIDYSEDGKHVRLLWDSSDGTRAAHTFTLLEDGSLQNSQVSLFIKKVANTPVGVDANGNNIFPTVNLDYNRLDDKEYMAEMSKLIFTNVMHNSPRTINDWFTYEKTDIQRKAKPPRESTGPRSESTPSGSVHIESGNSTIEISPSGSIAVDETTGALTEDQLAAIANSIIYDSRPAAPALSISELGSEWGDSPQSHPLPDLPKPRKRRAPRPGGNPLRVSDTQDQKATAQQLHEDVEKLSKLFPKLSEQGRVVLVKGLIKIINEQGNPEEVYGLFRNGVLYISDQSPKGTAFHEAFHYITSTLLQDSEKSALFEEASKIYGNLDRMALEEKLAEKFRQFMIERQDSSIKGTINNIFKSLKHILLSLLGRESQMDTLFWSIYRNKLNTRQDATSIDTFRQELLQYKNEKYQYDNLDSETLSYMEKRRFSKENYEQLTIEQKELLLQCM